MPWTPAQHRLFEAAAHDPKIAAARGIKQGDAKRMASEGIKKPGAPSPKPGKGLINRRPG